MKELTPNNERFWLIQLWLHIHNLMEDYILFNVWDSEDWGEEPSMDEIASDLRLVCPGQKLWFTPTELYQVWQYEHEHPEIYERCDDYIRNQGIKRIFTTAKS